MEEENKPENQPIHKETVEGKDKIIEKYYVMPDSLVRLTKTILIIGFIIFILVMIEFHIIFWQFLQGHYPSKILEALAGLNV